MDLFKTRISSISSTFFKVNDSVLVFYLRVDDIVVYQINKRGANTVVDFEIIYAIKTSLIDSLAKLLKQVVKHKSFNEKSNIHMVIDDHYLTMHRFTFTDSQLVDLHFSLDLEIDQLDDYEYATEQVYSDQPGVQMVLAYLIKKSILYSIENAFKLEKLTLKTIISRYQAFNYLFEDGNFKIEPSKSTVMVDISQTRIRLYISINGKVKIFRRMLIKYESMSFFGSKELDNLMISITPFIESAIESYLLKYSNHNISELYFVSDSVFLSPQNIKKYKIAGRPVLLLPIDATLFSFKKVTRKVTFLFAYAVFKLNSARRMPFNLIPVKYRLEKKIKFTFFVFALICCLLISIVQSTRYVNLKNQYNSFLLNRSNQVSETVNKRREMIALRDRINQQKKIIDFSDLTTIALKNDLRIDKFLFYLVNITTPDIEFKRLTIRNNKANIFGFSDSSNGNYSFFYFLQQLEGMPKFDRVRYNLGLDQSTQQSTFSLEVFFKSDD